MSLLACLLRPPCVGGPLMWYDVIIPWPILTAWAYSIYKSFFQLQKILFRIIVQLNLSFFNLMKENGDRVLEFKQPIK